MAVTWADSADKHGIAHEDARHAIGNACYVETEFDEPRVPGRVRPTLFIGPPRQLGGSRRTTRMPVGRAEDDIALKPASTTALRGLADAAHGLGAPEPTRGAAPPNPDLAEITIKPGYR